MSFDHVRVKRRSWNFSGSQPSPPSPEITIGFFVVIILLFWFCIGVWICKSVCKSKSDKRVASPVHPWSTSGSFSERGLMQDNFGLDFATNNRDWTGTQHIREPSHFNQRQEDRDNDNGSILIGLASLSSENFRPYTYESAPISNTPPKTENQLDKKLFVGPVSNGFVSVHI